MAAHRLVSLSRAKPGHEDEFRAWHRDQHAPALARLVGAAPEILEVAGSRGSGTWSCIVAFDVDSADPEAIAADVRRRLGTPDLAISDAADAAAELFVVAALELEARRKDAGAAELQFLALGDSPDAIEEVFSQLYKNADIAEAMRLPGAISARRYAIRASVGDCDWQMLTVFEFDSGDDEELTSDLAECVGIDPELPPQADGPLLLRLVGADG
jgi:hypothetical protein